MLSGTRTQALAVAVAFLAVSLAVAAVTVRTPTVATAGDLRAAASTIQIFGTAPADSATINTSTPIVIVVYGTVAPAVEAVELYLDGMNLTSAGTFDTTSFVLPLALELRNGPHVANFTVDDSLGGTAYANWTFTVDTVPPLLIVTAPVYPVVPTSAVLVQGTAMLASPYFAGAAPINVSATVLPSHASGWTLAPPNGSFSILVPLSQGVNTIFVNATDQLGNVATQIVNLVSDTVKPPLVILSPANLSVSPTNLVRVSGLSEFGAFLSVNGYSVTVAPNGTWSVLLALPEGLNVLQSAAADQVGNLNYAGLAVFVDSDVPRITLTSPTESLSSRSEVLVAGTVNDTKIVALLVNGLPVSVDATGAFSTTLTLLDGLDPIVIVAVDAAQHTTVLRTAVRVDTTPPSVTVLSPPDGLETNQFTVLLRGSVDDPNATVLVDDLMVHPDTSGRWQTTVALLPGGNAIIVSAVDAAGNRAAPIVVHVADFSPVPGLENRTSANAQSLEELGVVVRLSLVGILLLALGVEFMLYARSARQIRETRTLVAALARTRKPKT